MAWRMPVGEPQPWPFDDYGAFTGSDGSAGPAVTGSARKCKQTSQRPLRLASLETIEAVDDVRPPRLSSGGSFSGTFSGVDNDDLIAHAISGPEHMRCLHPAHRSSDIEKRSSRFYDTSKTSFPNCQTAAEYCRMRDGCRQLGPQQIHDDLASQGYIERTGLLAVGPDSPFNVFARITAGVYVQEEMVGEAERMSLAHQAYFMPACGRGKTNMSDRHRFMLIKDLSWWWFNALVIGMKGAGALEESIRIVTEMEKASREYASASDLGWSSNIGLYFHVYGHNSVNSLHLHIVDLDATTKFYDELNYKNLPVGEVLATLKAELAVCKRMGVAPDGLALHDVIAELNK